MDFGAAGGTIGRAARNNWVLPDPSVSNFHARIHFANGEFLIEDTSTNGVFMNGPDNRLTKGKPAVIRTGDTLLIDPYEIHVGVSHDEEPADDPFRPAGAAGGGAYPYPAANDPSGGVVDPLLALNLPPSVPPRPRGPKAEDLLGSSPLQEHYQPPPLVPSHTPTPAAGSMIPDDYDPFLKSEAKPRPPIAPRPEPPVESPRPSVPAAPSPKAGRASASAPAVGATDLAAVLEGAGINAASVTPELARDFGRVIRVVVDGLMEVLKSRTQIKDEFRMRQTSFKPSQNNPLKFSANVDDALHNLLVKRNAAYLGTVEAFEDAFADVRNHQMAMLEGIRVAFEATLKAFDPDRLQKEFEKRGKGSLISVGGKLKYWDQYRDKYSDMVSDADTCFRELFGEEFAKAYEEQLKRLKDQQGSRRPLI